MIGKMTAHAFLPGCIMSAILHPNRHIANPFGLPHLQEPAENRLPFLAPRD